MHLQTCLQRFLGKYCNQRLACRKHRQKRNVTLILLEGIIQWLNLLFYIIPNSMLWSNPCYITSGSWYWFGFARWTCWNTVSHLAAVSLALPQMACKPAALGYILSCICKHCPKCMPVVGSSVKPGAGAHGSASLHSTAPCLYTCMPGGDLLSPSMSMQCRACLCEPFLALHPSYAQQGRP